MKNQERHIPEHLQSRWEHMERELAIASEQLNEANTRYQRAILGRLALSQELENWHRSQD